MRSVGAVLFVGVVMLTLTACARGGAAPSPAPAWNPVPADAIIYSDNSGGIQDSLRIVVRDAARLGEIWQRATSQQTDPPAVPDVDFSREMVIVVAAGLMTPEDQIHVDSVVVRRQTNARGRTEQVMTAIVRTVEGCGRFRRDAYPIEIVRVRRFDGPVVFQERRERAQQC
jgi:hypothetical protein